MAFRTKWNGLWKNNDSEYAHSKILNKDLLSLLPDKFKIVVKKNKYHKKGDNKPSFTYAFCDISQDGISSEISSKELYFDNKLDYVVAALSIIQELEEAIEEAHYVNQNIEMYPNGNYSEDIFCFQAEMMASLDNISALVDKVKMELES